MTENLISIEQPIYCHSYSDALQISKSFENFSFRFIGLGGIRKVYSRRKIVREVSSSNFSHCVKISYSIPYRSDFLDYGFLDARTKKKYPHLESELKNEESLLRWRIVSKYQDIEDKYCRDIYYYQSFQDFFKTRLTDYLNQIFIASTISLASCYPCGAFIIRYIENNTNYEFAYFAYGQEGHYSSIDVKKYYPACDAEPIPLKQSWSWIKKNVCGKKDKTPTEHRSITALTYALNRTPSEQLFYSVLGLESIFTKDEKNAKRQLLNNIQHVFPFVTKDDIERIYKLRSEFAHGDLIFPLFYHQDETHWRAVNYWKPAQSASALLLLSIRLLVSQNIDSLAFNCTDQYTPEEFIDLSTKLFEELRITNAYWQLLQQFKENLQTFSAEMHYSPAFYNTIYLSLVESLYISLSKLYDWDNRSLTLRLLLANLECINEQNMHSDVQEKYKFCGMKFQRTLSPYEEPFFKKDVEQTKQIHRILGYQYVNTSVELSLKDTFLLYRKRFQSMQERKIIKNLIEQRSKIHAHNDKLTNFDYDSVWSDYPLSEHDLAELLDFAVDFLQFCVGVTTGVHKVIDYVNINDWQATLTLAREGQSHLDKELDKLTHTESP